MDGNNGPTPPRRRRLNNSIVNESQHYDAVYAGRIIRVHMENIMCHKNQEICFNPRVNFVTGNNGTGKSAIIASIVVGLGELATVTGRFRSLKEMIKSGENNGKITIELINEGCNAYKPDIYGNRITVVRSFTITGSNSYQIKSASGEVIARKKDELEKICQALNLSVKNPLCVLNQDTARTFLNNTTSSLRYILFQKATGLEEIQQCLDQSSTTLTSTKTLIDRKQQVFLELENELAEIRKKLEYARALASIVQERTELEYEMHWSAVIDQEKAIESIQTEKIILTKKLNQLEENIKNHQVRMNEINQKRQELNCDFKMYMQQKTELDSQKQEVVGSYNEMCNQLDIEEPAIISVKNKAHRIQDEIQRVNDLMAKMDERNKESVEDQNKNLERLRQTEEEMKTNQAQLSQAERELECAEQTLHKDAETLSDIRQTIKELNRNKFHKNNQIEALKNKSDMKSTLFGDYVPSLLEAIKANSARFEKEPVGPLGLYIKLRGDADWGPAIEAIIGNLMTAFCCNSDRDHLVFKEIMRKVISDGRNPPIIISPFLQSKHDISGKIVRVSDPSIKTIIEMINVSHNVAYNTLIDQAAVETILLFENDRTAAAKCTCIENVPRGLRMGITKDCDRYFPAPTYRTYAGRKMSRYFNQNENKSQLVEKLQKEIEEIGQELRSHVAQEADLRQRQTKFEAFICQTKQQLRDLRTTQSRLHREYNECKEMEESRPPPITRMALEEELQNLEKQKNELEKQATMKSVAIVKIKERKSAKQTLLNEINEKRDRLQNEIDAIEEYLEENDRAKKALEFMRNNADRQIEELKDKLMKNGESEVRNRVDLDEAIRAAEEIHPSRIDTHRTPREITKLLEEKDNYIKAAQKVTGDVNALAEEFQEKKSSLEDKRQSIKQHEINKLFFRDELKKRYTSLKDQREVCSSGIAMFFDSALATRGYRGELIIDHSNQTLELIIQPPNDVKLDKSTRRKDVKTLSGGEKSYSTVTIRFPDVCRASQKPNDYLLAVAFIQAIWRSTIMPFVVMDEFDVFMDEVNRGMVIEMLLQYAEATPNRQFIFLTPTDISMVKQNDGCSIFRMADHHKRPSH